jgi:hypothetical protein
MGKVETAIKAMEALPAYRREEVAEMVVELAEAIQGAPGRSALSEEQLTEVRRRRADGFKPGDASRIDQLLARLA